MQETSLAFDHTHQEISIYTGRRSERDGFVKRLEKYGWDYEVDDKEIDGEWDGAFIKVDWEAVRRPREIISVQYDRDGD